MSNKQLKFHPIISSIQKINLYETATRFYLIGSNNTQTRFRVLKIDRTDPRELLIVDDKVEYNKQEIHQLVDMIETGNRSARAGGVSKLVSAFGIIGFVRFLEGYYIILARKRRKVAVIGYHSIYKIEDSSLIYIPNDLSRPKHPDEAHYVRSFQAIDLSTNFYFSYSYDLTHSLQVNLAPPRQFSMNQCPPPPVVNNMRTDNYCDNDDLFGCDAKDCDCDAMNRLKEEDDLFETWKSQVNQRNITMGKRNTLEFGVRTVPEWRFVWNAHLLSPAHAQLHPDWIIYVIHGFVDQSNMTIFGRSVYITVVARRSNRYAGTRFLKRGANSDGDVANEVETEQMVHDSMISSLITGRFSSFVQLRGSVPGNWSQDISKLGPKPAITIDLTDPYFQIAAKHFNQLFERYGSPVVILNLVKKKEKKKHESFLSEEFSTSIKYLNQFLPPEHAIQYFHFDMARKNKGKAARVFDKLTERAHMGIKRTGIFVSCPPIGEHYGVPGHQSGTLQTGIIRVNCVDCLDRTNTAQFAIGKCALGYQLCALGLLDEPTLEFDTDCVRMLECLYEDHGDTLALQYGGSQLVHRIKTYRKTAPWTSQGNDIMQTLSRYLSNKLTDAAKQNTINLFLGFFVPEIGKPPLWEIPSDYYFHHDDSRNYKSISKHSKPLTLWWKPQVMKHLPISYVEMSKKCFEVVGLEGMGDGALLIEMIDAYHDFHRPYELSSVSECYGYTICSSANNFMPPNTTNASPFYIRGRPYGLSKRGPTSKNPGLSGRASSGSNNSSDSNSDSTSDDDITSSNASTRQVSPSPNKFDSSGTSVKYMSDWDKFPIVVRECRVPLNKPSKSDINMYKRYVSTIRKSSKIGSKLGTVDVNVRSAFSIDSSVCVIPPTVNKTSREIYKQYIDRYKGPAPPSSKSLRQYANYVKFTL